ncbi:unnamed protein product [Vicia faba]|uniref:Uncharacterized protein n=1 Tax=Vicia faba TaxID=3906 RepID=A0AAV1AK70_VICFA|nr:unnamed protein product [Vicia faba]
MKCKCLSKAYVPSRTLKIGQSSSAPISSPGRIPVSVSLPVSFEIHRSNISTTPPLKDKTLENPFIRNLLSMSAHPPIHPNTSTPSDPTNPHDDIYLRSITSLQKSKIASDNFWAKYITKQVGPRFPGLPTPDISTVQFPLLTLSSEASSDDEAPATQ